MHKFGTVINAINGKFKVQWEEMRWIFNFRASLGRGPWSERTWSESRPDKHIFYGKPWSPECMWQKQRRWLETIADHLGRWSSRRGQQTMGSRVGHEVIWDVITELSRSYQSCWGGRDLHSPMMLEPGSPLCAWLYAHAQVPTRAQVYAHWVVSGFVSVLSDGRRPDQEIKFGHLREYGLVF